MDWRRHIGWYPQLQRTDLVHLGWIVGEHTLTLPFRLRLRGVGEENFDRLPNSPGSSLLRNIRCASSTRSDFLTFPSARSAGLLPDALLWGRNFIYSFQRVSYKSILTPTLLF